MWLAETIATGTANATAATAPVSILFLARHGSPPEDLVADVEHRTCQREEARTNAKFREATRMLGGHSGEFLHGKAFRPRLPGAARVLG